MHACEIFEAQGMNCPFLPFEEDDDEDDDDRKTTKVGFPARRKVAGGNRRASVAVDVFRDTVPFVVAGDRLKQLEGAAERIPEVRELIPKMSVPLRGLPSFGEAGMLGSAAAIALGEALRRSRGTKGSLGIQRQVASAFGKASGGSSGGRGGGFNVNAAAELRSLLRPRKLREPGFGQFSLEGLGDLI